MDVSSALIQSASNLSLLNSMYGKGSTLAGPAPTDLVSSYSDMVSQLASGVPAVGTDVSLQMAAGALATLSVTPGAPLSASLYNSLGTYNLINQSTPEMLKGLVLDMQL